ncbi:MAG: tetratricopeptide repeat protein, partial [Acidobacteriota bacterium]
LQASKTFLFHRNRRFIIAGALLLLLIGAIAWYTLPGIFQSNSSAKTAVKTQEERPEALLERLSRSNFEGMEKQVVEKIRGLLEEVKQNPTSAFAWGKLGMNLDVHDLKTESLVCYEKAATLNPEDFRWPYYKGVVLDSQGSTDAVGYFERATTLKPEYAPAWIRLGQALFAAKRPEEAANKFQRAVQLEPTSHAHVGLARVYLSQGRLEESLSNLLEAVRLQPQHGEAHGLLSEVYRRLNRPQNAQAEMWISQQLPERTPLPDIQMGEWANEGVSSTWYDIRGRSYLQQGRYDEAVNELTKAVNAKADARILDTLGIAYQYLRRYDDAAKYHQQALALQPKSGSMLNNMASVYYEKGNLPKALEYMERAIQSEPTFAYSYHHLGQMHLRSGNRKAAIAAYQSGHERLPQNGQIATQLAWLLATTPDPSLRDGKEAVRLAEAVSKSTPVPDPQTLIALAAAYAETGEFDRAVTTASTARELLGNSGKNPIVQQLDSHIASYQQKKPHHE